MAILKDTKILGDLNVSGEVNAARVFNAVWNDIAEFMDKSPLGDAEAGDVLLQTKDGLIKSNERSSKFVVGVYSDTFGFVLGAENSEGKYPVGLSGKVNVKVREKLKIGDLLVSDIDGFAAKATDKEELKAGIIIGKVLEENNSNNVNRISMLIM